MISRDARRNRRGQMPLALVAVLLLAGCSFFGIIYSDIGRSADNAEAMGDEMASLDEAVEDAEFGIETALGLLLTDVSSEAEGNLADRAAAFRPAAERYFEETYPMHKGGVTTELVSEDVHLVLETLRPGDGDEVFTAGTRWHRTSERRGRWHSGSPPRALPRRGLWTSARTPHPACRWPSAPPPPSSWPPEAASPCSPR